MPNMLRNFCAKRVNQNLAGCVWVDASCSALQPENFSVLCDEQQQQHSYPCKAGKDSSEFADTNVHRTPAVTWYAKKASHLSLTALQEGEPA